MKTYESIIRSDCTVRDINRPLTKLVHPWTLIFNYQTLIHLTLCTRDGYIFIVITVLNTEPPVGTVGKKHVRRIAPNIIKPDSTSSFCVSVNFYNFYKLWLNLVSSINEQRFKFSGHVCVCVHKLGVHTYYT